MPTNADDVLIASLKQMVNYCKEIQELLKNDTDHFSKAEISAIEESNHHKTHLLDNLSHLLNELSSHTLKHKSGNFLEAIEQAGANMNEAARSELKAHIQELKLHLAACYESLIINSKVIYTNIHQLKALWDKLLNCRSEINVVYDNRGATT